MQDELLSAMQDIIYEIETKERYWATKGSKDQFGWPHDYCTFTKYKA